MNTTTLTRDEIRHALKGNPAYFMYPGKWDNETDDYIRGSIALDGRFTVKELEQIVSILRRAEVRGEK